MSSRYHPNSKQISPKYHPDITQISTRYLPDITQISSRYHPSIIQLLHKYHPNIIQISPKYHPDNTHWTSIFTTKTRGLTHIWHDYCKQIFQFETRLKLHFRKAKVEFYLSLTRVSVCWE